MEHDRDKTMKEKKKPVTIEKHKTYIENMNVLLMNDMFNGTCIRKSGKSYPEIVMKHSRSGAHTTMLNHGN